MKTCPKCKLEKNRTDFPMATARADGLGYSCKECMKDYQKRYIKRPGAQAAANARSAKCHSSEKGLARARAYSKKPESILRKLAYSKTESFKNYRAEITRRMRSSGMIKAHKLVHHKLQKQPCERCGSTKRIHGHHEDYSKPLNVMWLCPLHHAERHREIKREALATA